MLLTPGYTSTGTANHINGVGVQGQSGHRLPLVCLLETPICKLLTIGCLCAFCIAASVQGQSRPEG